MIASACIGNGWDRAVWPKREVEITLLPAREERGRTPLGGSRRGGGSSEIALLAECKSSRKEIARNKGRNREKKNALTKKEAVIRRE